MGQDKLDRDSVYKIGDDDVEGHRMGKPAAGGDDDVEGHRMGKPAAGGDDDVEGHRMGKPAAGGDDEPAPEGRTGRP